jgi:hypothetical protein
MLVPDLDSVDAARARLAAISGPHDAGGGVLAEDPSGNAVLVRSAPNH